MASECAAMQTSKGGSHDPTSEFGSLWHLASTSPLQPVNIIAKSVFLFFFPEMQCFFSIASFGVLQGTGKPLVRFHPLVPKQSVYTGGGQTLCFKGNLRGQGRDIHFQALAKIIHKGLHIHRM